MSRWSKASKAEYEAYQKAAGKHEKGTNDKPAESIRDMLELLVEQMKAGAGVTEKLKAAGQMEWVGRMNNLIACEKEIALNEIIY